MVSQYVYCTQMWGALLRGCAARLGTLAVARNPWSAARRPKDPPPSFRQFFTACLALTDLDFSYCKMPPDALKYVLHTYTESAIIHGIFYVGHKRPVNSTDRLVLLNFDNNLYLVT